ncbi:MAG: glycosyltransferase family 4 protein [Candidatus Saccharimonadales bacterium]
MKNLSNTTLVALASTYPRWPHDKVPTFVQDFVNWQSANFKQVKVIAPHHKGAAHIEKTQNGTSVRRFHYAYPYKFENIAYGEFRKNFLYPAKAALYIISELTTTFFTCLRCRPFILNAHWLIPQGFVAVLLKPLLGCKVVITIHGADVFTLNGAVASAAKRFGLKRADAVVCNSSATLAVCEKLYPRDDYKIISMGIDVDEFKAKKSSSKNGRLKILFVGRLVEAKGVIFLCQAVEQLVRSGETNLEATIIGGGTEEAGLQKYIKHHKLEKYIKLIGWVDHDRLPEYYAAADVFVGPSLISKNGWQEAFGLVFAESLATGTPVIGTKTGGIKDIVIDGENGFLVDQKNSRQIADRLQSLIDDPKLLKKMQAKSRQHIVDNFSWSAITKKYQQVFAKL